MKPSVRSKRPLMLLLASALSLSSCAVQSYTPQTPSASLELNLPAYLTEPCKAAAARLVAGGHTAEFAARQTDALAACAGKAEALIFAIRQHNAYLRQLNEARTREYCLATKPWYAPFRSC